MCESDPKPFTWKQAPFLLFQWGLFIRQTWQGRVRLPCCRQPQLIPLTKRQGEDPSGDYSVSPGHGGPFSLSGGAGRPSGCTIVSPDLLENQVPSTPVLLFSSRHDLSLNCAGISLAAAKNRPSPLERCQVTGSSASQDLLCHHSRPTASVLDQRLRKDSATATGPLPPSPLCAPQKKGAHLSVESGLELACFTRISGI